MSRSAVLMYHRVCPRSPATEPYFARGTAIEPQNFSAQIRWLLEHTSIGRAEEVLSRSNEDDSGRPSVALTFDDGYVDCATTVAPILAAIGTPWSVFVPSAVHAGADMPAWTDLYYAILAGAERKNPGSVPFLRTEQRCPSIDEDLRWWVRGPPKRQLARTEPAARRRLLQELAEELSAEVDPRTVCRTTYCSKTQLKSLSADGVTVGGHGKTHERLDGLQTDTLVDECASSFAFAQKLTASNAPLFCFPDGGCDERAVQAIREVGFAAAFTVEPGFVGQSVDPFRLPRFIVRNLPPGDPRWCAAFNTMPSTTNLRPGAWT